MSDDYTPTTEQVREAFRTAVLHPDDIDLDDAPGQEFDRYLAAHDAEIREQIAREIDARASQADNEDYTGGPAYTSGVRYGLTIAAAIAGGAS